MCKMSIKPEASVDNVLSYVDKQTLMFENTRQKPDSPQESSTDTMGWWKEDIQNWDKTWSNDNIDMWERIV